ncbi:hypothetical protein NP511_11220 [Natrinema thermotolerans]|uniref:Uncharacterized protein n=1 Tax=Natrinema thermotolerans TaxID=121872 RepID=A0AAF0SZR8_9EURY|nr:hypothetical protein [Natrinema thermotolerans]QCC59014.1 hypothetical protein DVR14_10360 [Natrinema thermotolerans]WMT05958.1 hypothetical protein NP511_11220 [Natrinema thermotolerans]
MVQVFALVIAGIFLLFGGVTLSRAGELDDRSETIGELASASDERVEPGGEATISGPVHVLESASPTRTGPEPNGGESAALWAWRVRQKENTGNGSRWRTAESELAIGEFAVDQGWDRVRVDATTLATDADGDPFDSPGLFLGDPETESYLGDLDPVNRFLERTGLASEDGVVSDLEFNVSVGGKTTMPDKYQATVVRDGDELVVRGELIETADGYALRGTDETPLAIAAGSLEDQREQVRSSVRLRRAAGGVFVGVGLLVAVLAVL